nr:hypothetical protein GCM10025732_40050 [Glycomyces mayteni]
MDGRVDPVLGAAGLDVAAGAVRGLADRGRGAPEHRGDLAEAVAEDVGEHEHGAFGGRQRLQDHHERHGHRLDVDGAVGSVVGGAVRPGGHRFGQPRPDVGLAAAAHGVLAGQRGVDRDAREVGAGVVDRRAVGAGLPGEPGLLEHVLGVGDGAEHRVDDAEQQFAVVGEHRGRGVRFGAGVHGGLLGRRVVLPI